MPAPVTAFMAKNMAKKMLQNKVPQQVQKQHKSIGKSSNPLSKNMFSKNSLSKNMFSKNPLSKNMFSKNPLSKNMFSKNPLSKNMFSKNPLSKNMFSKNPFVQLKNPFNRERLLNSASNQNSKTSKIIPKTLSGMFSNMLRKKDKGDVQGNVPGIVSGNVQENVQDESNVTQSEVENTFDLQNDESDIETHSQVVQDSLDKVNTIEHDNGSVISQMNKLMDKYEKKRVKMHVLLNHQQNKLMTNTNSSDIGIFSTILCIFFVLEACKQSYLVWTNKHIPIYEEPRVMNVILWCIIMSIFGLYGIYQSQSSIVYQTTTTILTILLVLVVIEYYAKKWYFFQRYKAYNLDGIRTSCIHNNHGLPNQLGYFHNDTCTTWNSSDSVVHIKHSNPSSLKTTNIIDISNKTVTNDKYDVQYTILIIQCMVLGVLFAIVRFLFTENTETQNTKLQQ